MFRSLEVVLATGLLGAPPALATDKQLDVAAAASLQDVLEAIDKIIPKDVLEGGVKIVYNFGATSMLARQIEADAPVDVLVSADEANMDRLEKAGKLDPKTRAVVTANELVIVVKPAAKPDLVLGPKDLLKDDVKRVALCDEAVPIGHYGKELLTKLGLHDKLLTKFVRPESVRATLMTVEADAADVGFVYATDVRKDSKTRIVYKAGLKEGLNIKYPAAVTKRAVPADAAGKYVQFLGSAEAQKIFQAYGFVSRPAS